MPPHGLSTGRACVRASLVLAVFACAAASASEPDLLFPPEPIGQTAAPRFWGIAGQQLKIPLEAVAPTGWTGRLDVALFQSAGELAAPLLENPVAPIPVQFNDRTATRIDLPLVLPQVEHPSRVVARLRLKSESGDSTVTRAIVIGVLPGPASPQNPIRRLKDLEDGTVAIRGDSPRLRAFFDTNAIAYVDASDARSGAVVLCEADEMPQASERGASVLWFAPPDDLLPGVYPNASGVTKITVSILETLQFNPRAQETLAALITRNVRSSPP